MSIKNTIKKISSYCKKNYYYKSMYYSEINKIKRKRNIWKKVVLTKEQVNAIEAIYGKGIDTRWHRYYQYFTGVFDAYYFPEIIYSTKLEPRLNPRFITNVLQDKGLLEILYGSVEGLHIPKTIVLNCSGVYYDGNRNIISKEQAILIVRKYLDEYNIAVIKPTLDTMSGKNVLLLKKDTILSQIVGNTYVSDFVIQEKIENQDDIRKLNPWSFNTMRVITYICKEQFFVAPIILRIGGNCSHLDNAHAGGIFVGVNDDGILNQQAFSEYGQKYDKHPVTEIVFDGYKIDGIHKVKEKALECHKLTPHLRMISWDFSLDSNGIPTLIETNQYGQSVWLSQIAHGRSIFGENTQSMLDIVRNNNTICGNKINCQMIRK